MVTAAMKLKGLLLGRKAMTTLDGTLKSRDLARAVGASHLSKTAAGGLRTRGGLGQRLSGRASPCRLLPHLRKLTSSNNRPREDGWLKSLFVQKVDPGTDAHSNLLAKKETSSLYKLQFHDVTPERLEAYNKIGQEVLQKIHEDKHYPCTLVGTWKVVWRAGSSCSPQGV